jgi:hypothetical protein
MGGWYEARDGACQYPAFPKKWKVAIEATREKVSRLRRNLSFVKLVMPGL